MSQPAPLLIPILALILALAWGVVWALALQYTRLGRFLARRRTWLTVVVGVGVDLLIALLLLELGDWLLLVALVIASSIGVIWRSLHNEGQEEQELIDAYKPD